MKKPKMGGKSNLIHHSLQRIRNGCDFGPTVGVGLPERERSEVMVKRMKLWVAGALLVGVGGSVVASNMGFKFVPNLNQGNPKIFTISLPLNNNYTNAESVRADIAGTCSPAKIARVNPNQSQTTWVGTGLPTDNFAIVKGQGYILATNGTCTNWVVVGSHDPAYVYSFPQANPSIYLTSIPYHTTATVAEDLRTSIPSAAKIARINPNQSQTTWVGTGLPTDNFSVVIGEAYIVAVNTAGTTWTPAHY